MNKWLLIQKDYGQLGNRLHTHANALAWCVENKVNLINLSFRKYSHLFCNDKNQTAEMFFSHKSRFEKLITSKTFLKSVETIIIRNRYIKQFKGLRVIEKEDDNFISEKELNQYFEIKKNSKIVIIKSWDLQFSDALKKHQNKVRNILLPNKIHREVAYRRIKQLREKFDCVVGIHARRGDYKNFLEGIHYHSWSKYKNWIVETKKTIEKNLQLKVGFLLCSDESPPVNLFNTPYIVTYNDTETITDIHALSLCDYNIGPPSSFGTWVSFHGKVPRLIVYTKTKITSMNQFIINEIC